ncbi:hypothetical protein N9C96_00255 [bacterium]|nr:hypothetical protein [bacterium]
MRTFIETRLEESLLQAKATGAGYAAKDEGSLTTFSLLNNACCKQSDTNLHIKPSAKMDDALVKAAFEAPSLSATGLQDYTFKTGDYFDVAGPQISAVRAFGASQISQPRLTE